MMALTGLPRSRYLERGVCEVGGKLVPATNGK